MQKIAVITIALAYTTYALFETESYTLNPEQFFRPYSKILFVLLIAVTLIFIKYKNWKSKIKVLTLIATLTFIFYNTSLQLQNFFESGTRIFGEVKFSQFETMGPYVDFQIYYRLGKIVLLDLFAIFAFFAINKTVNEVEETKE